MNLPTHGQLARSWALGILALFGCQDLGTYWRMDAGYDDGGSTEGAGPAVDRGPVDVVSTMPSSWLWRSHPTWRLVPGRRGTLEARVVETDTRGLSQLATEMNQRAEVLTAATTISTGYRLVVGRRYDQAPRSTEIEFAVNLTGDLERAMSEWAARGLVVTNAVATGTGYLLVAQNAGSPGSFGVAVTRVPGADLSDAAAKVGRAAATVTGLGVGSGGYLLFTAYPSAEEPASDISVQQIPGRDLGARCRELSGQGFAMNVVIGDAGFVLLGQRPTGPAPPTLDAEVIHTSAALFPERVRQLAADDMVVVWIAGAAAEVTALAVRRQ